MALGKLKQVNEDKILVKQKKQNMVKFLLLT